jgi:hypothetical protein
MEDPSALFQTFDVMPNENMTDAERLNALTRVIILITAFMFIVKFPLWWMFLGIGIIVVIVLWYIVKERDKVYEDNVRRQTEYLRRPRKSIIQPYYPTKNSIIDKSNNEIRGYQSKGKFIESDLIRSVQTQQLKLISIP